MSTENIEDSQESSKFVIDLKNVGRKIRQLRGDLSQREFAWRAGIHRNDVSRLERGEFSYPPLEVLVRIIDAAGSPLTLDQLLRGDQGLPFKINDQAAEWKQGRPETRGDFVFVPYYNVEASAGGGSLVTDEAVVDWLAFKREWVSSHLGASPENLLLIKAAGDSMEPHISEGDLLLVDRGRNQVPPDGVYCITLEGELMVKRVQRLPDQVIVVKPDNPAYQQYTLAGEALNKLRVIGRVVWIGRDF